ncbi:hypothetical protein D1871_00170 [Nakamurella silvestris]|nr:hypothetical protein D1871_00170 [Nakamurella silvestris]
MRLAVITAVLACAGALFFTPGVAAATASGQVATAPHRGVPLAAALATAAPAATTIPVVNATDDDPFPMDKTLSFSVSSISPEVVTSTGPTTLTISGTLKNVSENRLSDLITRVQRGAKQKNIGAVRNELEKPGQPEQVLTEFTGMRGTLAKGESLPFTVSVPLVGDGENSLKITEPGVYPLLVNVNGVVNTDSQTFPSRIGALYLMLSVTSVPAAPEAVATAARISVPRIDPAQDVAGPTGTVTSTSRVDASYLGSPAARTPPAGSAPIEVNMLWPVIDRPHVAADGSFLDDDLALSLANGGRLDSVLDVLEQSTPPAGSVTLVVDPELLDELDRMSHGYVVGPAPLDLDKIAAEAATSTAVPGSTEVTDPVPPTTQPPGGETSASGQAGTTGATAPAATGGTGTVQHTGPATGEAGSTGTPTTTGTAPATPGDEDPTTEPVVPGEGQTLGAGTAAATAYLDRLKDLARIYPVLVLPYSDPDTVALTRAGMKGFLDATVARGREVAHAVLGPSAAEAGPGGGLVDTITWPVSGLIDNETAGALRTVGIDGLVLNPSASASKITNGQLDTAAGSTRLVVTDRQVSRVVDGLMTKGPGARFPQTMNDLAAITVQLGLDGTGRTMVFAPSRTWQPDAEGVRSWLGLLGTLGQDQLAAGRSLPDLAAKTGRLSSVVYPELATAAELSPATVSKVGQTQGLAASMDEVMVRVTSAGPQTIGVLAPLVQGMYSGAAAAFRTDPVLAAKWRAPADAAIAEISSKVSLQTPSSTYRLTSSSSPLILTVKNDLPFEIRVKVAIVDPERAGLVLEAPQEQLIPPLRNKQITLAATVTLTGTFKVQAEILTPDNTPWGLPTYLHLKSTAFGAFTITMMIGAGAVLVITVAWRIRQRWRQRQVRISEGLQGRSLRGPGSQDTTISRTAGTT